MILRSMIRGAALAPFFCAAALAAPHQRDAFIAQYDTDGDSRVTRAEFEAEREQRFRRTDTDGDGVLSPAEYLIEYVGLLDAQLAQSSTSEADKTATRQRQYRQTLVRFGAIDTDKDGQITAAEYAASGTRAFENHDTDKDSVVSRDDVPNERRARQQRKAE